MLEGHGCGTSLVTVVLWSQVSLRIKTYARLQVLGDTAIMRPFRPTKKPELVSPEATPHKANLDPSEPDACDLPTLPDNSMFRTSCHIAQVNARSGPHVHSMFEVHCP